ncbi:MAG: outer membrane lipoprotein-sorting protein [Gemmatimonadales bacterium]|jgi:outer membrane lipoprotein-sorting protein
MTRARSLVLALSLSAFTPGPAQAQESAADIIDRVDRILRGESSHGTASMEIVTEHWERSMTMEIWSLGTDYSLIRVTAPKSEEGTATLKAGDDIWNYLPRVDRTIKIPPSMMMSSWMGSHFTNDDLVKESRLVDDYDIEIAFEGDRDGVRVWEFELTPKPEAAVVWGSILYRVRKEDLMPLWAKYYDEDGKLVRTMTFSDFRVMGGRLIPAALEVQPENKPGEHTRVQYSELEFNIDIDTDFFSLRNLRSGGR